MSKRKNKGRRYKYDKGEFVSQVCSECGLCVTGNPEFCYDGIYKVSPKQFMNSTIYRLFDQVNLFKSMGFKDFGNECADEDITELLRVFCDTNSCRTSCTYKECKNVIGCMLILRQQVRGSKRAAMVQLAPTPMSTKKLSKKEKKALRKAWRGQRQPPKRNPTPTFFCNEGFEAEVEELLKQRSIV